jgi:hypothetical protein
VQLPGRDGNPFSPILFEPILFRPRNSNRHCFHFVAVSITTGEKIMSSGVAHFGQHHTRSVFPVSRWKPTVTRWHLGHSPRPGSVHRRSLFTIFTSVTFPIPIPVLMDM